MFKHIFRFLDKSGNEHEDQRRLYISFIIIALVVVLVSSPLTITAVGIYAFLVFITLLLISLAFAYKNQLWPARVITPLAGFILITRLLFGGGIHDDALGGYYLILIIAGLMIGQRALLTFGLMSAMAVVVIGLAETSGIISTRFGPLTERPTITTTAFFLLGTTFGLNYMVLRLNRAIRIAQQNEAAQVEANRELLELRAALEVRVEERTSELDLANQQLTLQFERINALQAKLREEAIRDPLTGLFNRRHLDEMLVIELSRSKRAGTPLTILMLDIDHFKNINDTYGHQVGDTVLQTVARTLSTNVRAGDIVCRYGGEEFTLVFPGMKAIDGHARAEVLRTLVALQTINDKGRTIRVTISIGGSVYPQDGTSNEELMSLADHALYQAKQNGRNQVQFALRKDKT
ncbi:MAG: diguanylate cyclase [Anaerolineales bacterium]|nr:diguanylate cyclase [Anaerolineales bacterium]